MNLNQLRQQIDQIDQHLLKLLNKRLKLAQKIGETKKIAQQPIFDPAREALLLKQLHDKNRGPLSSRTLAAIYREILAASRSVQKKITNTKRLPQKIKKEAFSSKKSMLQ